MPKICLVILSALSMLSVGAEPPVLGIPVGDADCLKEVLAVARGEAAHERAAVAFRAAHHPRAELIAAQLELARLPVGDFRRVLLEAKIDKLIEKHKDWVPSVLQNPEYRGGFVEEATITCEQMLDRELIANAFAAVPTLRFLDCGASSSGFIAFREGVSLKSLSSRKNLPDFVNRLAVFTRPLGGTENIIGLSFPKEFHLVFGVYGPNGELLRITFPFLAPDWEGSQLLLDSQRFPEGSTLKLIGGGRALVGADLPPLFCSEANWESRFLGMDRGFRRSFEGTPWDPPPQEPPRPRGP